MSSGGGGPQTVSTNGYRYPKWAEPAIMQYFVDAIAMSYTAFQQYETLYSTVGTTPAPVAGSPWIWNGITYSHLAPDTNETNGIAATVARALSGSLPVQSAVALITANLAGSNLTAKYGRKGDEYKARVDSLKQEFTEMTIPMLAERYEALGAFGGSAHGRAQYQAAEDLARKILQVGKEIFYGDFTDARRAMAAAIADTLPIANQAFTDLHNLRQAGLLRRENTTQLLNTDYTAYRLRMELPIQRYGVLGNAVRMLSGTSSAEIRPYYKPSGFTEVAGLGLTALGAYASFSGRGAASSSGRDAAKGVA